MSERTDHEPSRKSSAFGLLPERAFAVFTTARSFLKSFRRVDAIRSFLKSFRRVDAIRPFLEPFRRVDAIRPSSRFLH
ncbi:hypothetical protein CDV31_016812 [Fusarium ambrosium]|uniref:Uncharacterized protein n=1 Tax=Fusarium ambrosium TaxID=131363 RepID=A0A428S1D6_9HYPO|nr:hypothetical protein CDV31_016812 [Fusarium ambrosium]